MKRATVDSLYDTLEAQSCVLEQAKEIQANLEPEFPSLVKTMLPSNVTGGFWLVNLTLSVELGRNQQTYCMCQLFLNDRVSQSTFVVHICLCKIQQFFWKMKVGKHLKQNILWKRWDLVLDGEGFPFLTN